MSPDVCTPIPGQYGKINKFHPLVPGHITIEAITLLLLSPSVVVAYNLVLGMF